MQRSKLPAADANTSASAVPQTSCKLNLLSALSLSLEGVAGWLAGWLIPYLARNTFPIHTSVSISPRASGYMHKGPISALSSRFRLCAEINLWPVVSEIANTFLPRGRAYDGNSLRAEWPVGYRKLLKGCAGGKVE